MSEFDAITARSDAGALIPEDVAAEIIQGTVENSAVLSLFRRANMSRKQQRLPVLAAFPEAYFVNGDTGLKQTTKQAWANKYLNAEEIACIVPVPEAVLDDADYDIWGEIQPRAVEAIGRTLDEAVFFGTDAPSTWPTNVSAAAAAAGNTNAEGNSAATGGFFGDIDETLALVEADGFDSTGIVADRTAKGKFRAARNADGDRLDRDRVGADLMSLDGDPIVYSMRGLWPNNVRLILGDWSQFVVAVRQDITYKILDQAVITDGDGNIVYNLAQQDMIALRVVARFAWQVANPLTREQPTEASRYPAARLTY